jgi:hypothetical protein
VVAFDETPNPELSYDAEVLAEGADARQVGLMSAADRVFAVLPASAEAALLVKEIGDLVAHDATGRGGLKHDTIRKALNRDLDGKVNNIGEHMDVRWWRA